MNPTPTQKSEENCPSCGKIRSMSYGGTCGWCGVFLPATEAKAETINDKCPCTPEAAYRHHAVDMDEETGREIAEIKRPTATSKPAGEIICPACHGVNTPNGCPACGEPPSTPHPTGGATPRTDAESHPASKFSPTRAVVRADFARQLETELTQAKADLAKANKLSEDRRTSGIHLVEQMDLKCAELTQERAKCAELEHELNNVWKPCAAMNEQYAKAFEDKNKEQTAEIARLEFLLKAAHPHVSKAALVPSLLGGSLYEAIETALAAGREAKP